MQEILITLLIFGVAVLLASTQYRPADAAAAREHRKSTGDRFTPGSQPIAKKTIQPVPENSTRPTAESNAAQPAASPVPFLELESPVSLPLATSLPLQDAIHPETLKVDTVPDLISNSSTIIESTDEGGTEASPDREHPSVLEEIAQIDAADREGAIASLIQQVNHPDPLMRATAAICLGELAASNQGQPQTEIIALLNGLLQDSDSEVRLQAAAALGKMQSPLT